MYKLLANRRPPEPERRMNQTAAPQATEPDCQLPITGGPDAPGASTQTRWLIAALGLLLVLLAFFVQDRYRQAQADAASDTRSLVQLVESHLAGDLASVDAVLAHMASRVSAADLRPALPLAAQTPQGLRLDDLQASVPMIAELSVFDAQGVLRYASDPSVKDISIADRPHFLRLRDDPKAQLTFSEAQIARTTGRWSIVMVRALRDGQGRFLGTVNAVIGLDGIGKLLGTVDVGADGGVLLRSSETFKLIQRMPRHNEKDFNQPLPKDNAIRARIEAGERAGTLSFTASTDGVERLASFKVMADYPFYVQVGLAKSDYLAVWRQEAAAVASLVALLLPGFAYVIKRKNKCAAMMTATTRQLAYRQALFAGLFEQSCFLTGILDASWHLLEVNQAALAIIGRHRDEVIGQNFADTPWWSRAEDRAVLQATLQATAQGTAGSFEALHPGPGGADITVLFHAVPVQAGLARYIAVTGIDISAIKAAEQQLVAQSQRLANILWGTGVGLWEWNVQTGETCFNQRWAELIGYTLDELAPVSIATWMKFTHPDDLAASGIALQQHFAGEIDHYEFEARMRHKLGHWIWVLDRGRVNTWSADGKPLWMAGTHWDITERKLAEQALRANEAFLQQVLNSLPNQVTVIDQSGSILMVNEAWRQFSRQNSQQPGQMAPGTDVGANYLKVCSGLGGDAQAAVEGIQAVLDGRLPGFGLKYPCHSPQAQHWFAMSVSPLTAGKKGAVVAHHDITQRKQAEQVLLQQTEALARSNTELEQFAYVVSHDLRQPLRMVNSYLQLIERALAGQLDDDTREMMHYATDGAKRMDQMLMSLLEYSRVGRKGEPLLPLASREAVDEALRFLEPAIHEAQATVRLSGDWPQMVELQVREIERGKRQQMALLLAGLVVQAGVIVWLVITIRHRRSLERERETLLASLQARNAELGRLGEVMAHHFQEPTRRLASFAQRLLAKSALADDEDSRLSLHFIDSESKRLSELVRQAQRYLALDHRQVNTTEAADSAAALRQCIEAAASAAAGAEIVLREPLPRVRLAEKTLRELFAMLLDNALRYRHPQRPLRIEVSAATEGDRVVFRFADNGSGIAPEYRTQALGLFTRLVPSSIPGTGMGLALACKITGLCGGQLHIEDGQDGGACIVFDLPLETTA